MGRNRSDNRSIDLIQLRADLVGEFFRSGVCLTGDNIRDVTFELSLKVHALAQRLIVLDQVLKTGRLFGSQLTVNVKPDLLSGRWVGHSSLKLRWMLSALRYGI